jgi:hypothetical protein
MRDGHYLRAQAKLCLEIALVLSDRKGADELQTEAARYHAEATQLEIPKRPESQDS